jgi:hypothetical protein
MRYYNNKLRYEQKGENIMLAATFAAVAFTLHVGHHLGDYWAQTDHQSSNKGKPGWQGRIACAKHVASYTAITAGLVALVNWLLHLDITLAGFILGQTVSAVSHYWADRRFTLAKLCKLLGKEKFYRMGSPRADKDDNITLGTGAHYLDQSWHIGWLFIAALVSTLV